MGLPRVAVTGLGVVSAFGQDVDEFFSAVLAGKTAIRPQERLTAERLEHVNAACVQRPDVLRRLSGNEQRMTWASAMGVVAARNALTDAGLDSTVGNGGLYVNTIVGAPASLEGAIADWRKVSFGEPRFAEREPHGARVAALARAVGAASEVQCFVVPCAGNIALGSALDSLRSDRVPFAVAGGIEEISIGFCAAFERIGVLGDNCRPFDAERDGLVIGEGAAFIVLESVVRAKQRGARIYAELLAVGCSNDAYDLVAPEPRGIGAALALRRTLQEAGLQPSSIDYVNAHGTGTKLNDEAEARAMHEVLSRGRQDTAAHMRISSTKGATGHAMGAASAIEAVITVLAVDRGESPPTAGLRRTDPKLALGGLIRASVKAPVHAALSNGFGLGGNNAVAAFAQPGGGDPHAATRPVYVKGAACLAAGVFGVAEACSRVEAQTPLDSAAARFDFKPKNVLGRKRLRHADRATVMVGAALVTELQDWPTLAPEQAGIVIGVAHPSFESSLNVMKRLQKGGPSKLHPGAVPHSTSNSTASWLAIRTGVTGLSTTISSGDCAALDAVAHAVMQLHHERLDAAIAGGAFGYCQELWAALAAAGRSECAEAAALVSLDCDPEGAWAEVRSTASGFDGSDAAAAQEAACTTAMGRAGIDTADIGFVGHPGDEVPAARLLSLQNVVGDCAAARAAVALAVAAAMVRGSPGATALIADRSPEGYASAMVLGCPAD